MTRQRLLSVLDSPLPLLVIEAVPGGGKRTLLNQWLQESATERRHLIRAANATSSLQILHLMLATLGGGTAGSDQAELVAEIRRRALAAPQPLALAIIEADELDADALAAMLQPLVDNPRLRVTVALFDSVSVIQAATQLNVAYTVLDDHDLEFTEDEVRELLAMNRMGTAPGAVAALREATFGHPGLLTAAITALPQDVEAGRVSRIQALAIFLAGGGPVAWPSALARFVSLLVGIPRFSAQQAELITGDHRASTHLHRLRRIGLGEMAYLPTIRQRVFRWDEPVRLGIARYIEEVDQPRNETHQRVLVAARKTQDRELELVTLLATGRLGEAERLVTHWLWDLLPDGPEPIWGPLQQLSSRRLVEYPGLLCLRLRVGVAPTRPLPPGTVGAIADRVVSGASRSPWRRLGALARALELARQGSEIEQVKTLAARAHGLASELMDENPPAKPAIGSDLLMIAQTAFQLGSGSYAAEFAQLALEAIEADPAQLDPTGARRAFAIRVILFSHRERGLEDPPEAPGFLTGGDFTREADAVAAELAQTWRALDAGSLTEAESHSRVAITRVTRPSDWPALVFTRVILLALTGHSIELEALLERYQQLSPRRQAIAHPAQQQADQLLQRLIGRYPLAPEPLMVDESPDAVFAPRLNHGKCLLAALEALRAGRPVDARASLERAIAALPSHPLAPLTLAHASVDELRQLGELIAGHPGGSELHLEYAAEYSLPRYESTATLSERELEVLSLLRGGATNQEMADRLFVSVNTVKFHRANLMRKLGARSRDQLLATATNLGL